MGAKWLTKAKKGEVRNEGNREAWVPNGLQRLKRERCAMKGTEKHVCQVAGLTLAAPFFSISGRGAAQAMRSKLWIPEGEASDWNPAGWNMAVQIWEPLMKVLLD
eukprot:755468-Pelagomonas_calceolata.AAC.7